jgi:beta-fructofuranosidase
MPISHTQPEMAVPQPREDHKRVATPAFNRRYRPAYHFSCPEGNAFPFDPNGALFWRGRYHLFYIYDDHGPCWGHVSSADLICWKRHPVALAPRAGDPERGIFSGNAFVNHRGVPTIIYHGLGSGTCIATSEDDELEVWNKSLHNPVISEATKEGDPGWGVYNVFDPHAWVEGETTYAILGGKVKPDDKRDTAYLFRSTDLVRWEYLRQFYSPDPQWTGEEEDCACPDFFELGGRHVLMCISHARGERYYLGRYEDHAFVPEEHHRINRPGGSCFAAESLLDERGRRMSWAWVLGQCSAGKFAHELGVLTMPRVLTLGRDGLLHMAPPAELQKLRRASVCRTEHVVFAHTDNEVVGYHGDVAEISLQLNVAESGAFTLGVCASPDRAEETKIVLNFSEGTLAIDTSRSSINPDVYQPDPVFAPGKPHRDVRVQVAPLRLMPNEELELRVFLDRSIVEVFANGQYLVQRIYPAREDSQEIYVSACESDCMVRELKVWKLSPIEVV